MKKPYQKPMLYAESFALVEHIADCSGAIPQNKDRAGAFNSTDCTYEDPSFGTLFGGNNPDCLIPVGGDDLGFDWKNGLVPK